MLWRASSICALKSAEAAEAAPLGFLASGSRR